MNVRLGQVLKSKQGNNYIQLSNVRDKEGKLIGKSSLVFPIKLSVQTEEGVKEVELTEGSAVFLTSPLDQIDYLAQEGKISLQEAEARKKKIPDFVRYNAEIPLKGV